MNHYSLALFVSIAILSTALCAQDTSTPTSSTSDVRDARNAVAGLDVADGLEATTRTRLPLRLLRVSVSSREATGPLLK